jgi:transcriptional regulator with XRE-family HTH domain
MSNIVGRNIKAARKERGISTIKLAEITGISQSTISKLENGNRSPDLDLVKTISESLGVPLGYMVEGTDKLMETIQGILEKDNLTVEELSSKLGINVSDISEIIESNGALTYSRYKELIKKILESADNNYFYDFAEFGTAMFRQENSITNSCSNTSFLCTSDEISLIKKYRRISKADRENINTLLDLAYDRAEAKSEGSKKGNDIAENVG